MTDLGWHVISGEDLLAMLRRVENGENPDLVYAEEWANADHEKIEPVCSWCEQHGSCDPANCPKHA